MFVFFSFSLGFLFLTTKRISNWPNTHHSTAVVIFVNRKKYILADLIWSQSYFFGLFYPCNNKNNNKNQTGDGWLRWLIVFLLLICISFFLNFFCLHLTTYHIYLSFNFFSYNDHFLLNDRFINFDNDLSNLLFCSYSYFFITK